MLVEPITQPSGVQHLKDAVADFVGVDHGSDAGGSGVSGMYRYTARAIALITIVATTGIATAQAAPTCKSPVFYCELQKVLKAVQVCEQPLGRLRYSYGPLNGEPELVFSVQPQQAEITPWNGVGTLYWASLEMPNGAWRYRMSVIYPRDGAPESDSGTLSVSRDGEERRHWRCDPATLQERIESLRP